MLAKNCKRTHFTRKYLFSKNFQPKIGDYTLIRIYSGLKKLEIKEYKISVSLLIRAFLEKIYILYYESFKSTPKRDMKLPKIIQEIRKELKGKSKPLTRQEEDASEHLGKIESDKDYPLNPKMLGKSAHATSIPSSERLKSEWDNIELRICLLSSDAPASFRAS